MRIDRTNWHRVAAAVVAVGLGGTAMAQPGGGRAARNDDAAARALFDKVADAYKGLTSYSDEGQFVVALTLGGKAHRQVRPLKLTFVRPNKLDLDAGAVRLVSDGQTITTAIEPLKKYVTAPAPEAINIDTFREGPTGAVLFGGPTAAPTASPMFVLLNLLTGASPVKVLEQMGGTLRPAPAAGDKPNGEALVIDLQEGPDLLLRVDPATRLLSSIELKIDPAQLAKSAPPGQTLSIEQFGWTSGAVSTKVAADRSFAFVAPKGFSAIEGLKEQPGGAGQAPQYAVQEKLGKPAPEFTLTLLDGPDKTRMLTKADLAGKVIVIDFWATWCGPCLMELPEIQKLVEHYKDSKKDVLVVALSQDTEPREIAEVRSLVEKTLTDKKINLTAGPAGRIGLDPSNSVGKAFDIEGFPTLVILDGKGVVQSAHVGYNPDAAEPLHKTLAAEIDTLLEGKSLVGEKGKGATGPQKDEHKE
jgi:thiol-disulfide isomerase/thioredoxin